jgi:8-oxo-dGTP pyrophosphatase MutT (NUDIX family)
MPAGVTLPTFGLQAIRAALKDYKADKTPLPGRPAAVLVPLFERDSRVHILLTQRTNDLPSHAGQISFPGGKPEPGDSGPRATALREAQEEIGLLPSSVDVIGQLDDCATFVTNYLITPIVGVIPDRSDRVVNPREIASLIEAPLDDFLVRGALRTEPVVRAGLPVIRFYYLIQGHIVWGATARILTQLFSVIGAPVEVSS